MGGRLSVHDRLGERVGYFPRNQEEHEEMTNAATTWKRRMQRERQEELSREENSAKSGDRQQPNHMEKGPSIDVNMVFMLLWGYKPLYPYG